MRWRRMVGGAYPPVLLLIFLIVMVFLMTSGIRLLGGRDEDLAGLLTMRIDPATRSSTIEATSAAEGEVAPATGDLVG